jgi:uncharacterized protein (DUF2141 family)
MRVHVLGFMLALFSFAQAQSPMMVIVEGLREPKGQLVVLMFNNAEDFPTKQDQAIFTNKVQVYGPTARIVFETVPAGTYAIAVYHDENMNGKMDRHWYGPPKEGYGASNDAKGKFGPPQFDDAKFEVNETQTTIKIIIHY